MVCCAILGCENHARKTKDKPIRITYHKFPKKEEVVKQWLEACKRGDKINLKNACICSRHFESSCYKIPLRNQLLKYVPRNCRLLTEDAVPTLHLPGKVSPVKTSNTDEEMAEAEAKHALLLYEITHSTPQDINNTADSDCNGKNCVERDVMLKCAEREISMLKEKVSILEGEKTTLIKTIKDLKASNKNIRGNFHIWPGQKLAKKK